MKTLSALFLLFLLASCGGKYACPNQPLLPSFIGYKAAEVDSFILKRFAPGSNFTQLTDSFFYDFRSLYLRQHGDTVDVSFTGNSKRLDDDAEYRLQNVFDGKTVSVAGMSFEKKEEHGHSLFGWDDFDACVSPVVSYQRDGAAVTVSKNELPYLYIRK